MKYKVEGESSEGNYLDGQSFETEQEANREVWALSQEFPENSSWVEVEGPDHKNYCSSG